MRNLTLSSTGLLGKFLSDITVTLCLIHWLRYFTMFWYSTHLMSTSCVRNTINQLLFKICIFHFNSKKNVNTVTLHQYGIILWDMSFLGFLALPSYCTHLFIYSRIASMLDSRSMCLKR